MKNVDRIQFGMKESQKRTIGKDHIERRRFFREKEIVVLGHSETIELGETRRAPG